MVASSTLLVRHMPSELTPEEKEDFLKHFGAKSVKIFGSKNTKSNNVFATFETHSVAKAALQQLHQTELLGQLLAVEFARGENISSTNNVSVQDAKKVCTGDSKEKKTRKYYENFLYRLSSWTTGIDFNIPPPVHLKYQYPPPSRNTIENIAKALATVPKFYTQVLHLMNKMNLPCPFTDSFPIKSDILENKILKEIEDNSDPSQRILTDTVHAKETSSEEESEMDSGDDESKSKLNEIIPSKRKIPDKKRKVKRPKFIKPVVPYTTQVTSKSVLKAEEVFEVADKEPQSRKIEVKITPDLISIQEAEETQKSADTVEGFEKLPANAVSLDESERKGNSFAEEEENVGTCITEHELSANRISTRDQRILPVFNSYQPGAPSCRLYIKNLAKQVQTRDLHYIFRRYYFPDQEEQGTMFDVRLMQEGRMKGQAFINLQSVELAQKALKETNGFILKDKPMVVQFARSSKAK